MIDIIKNQNDVEEAVIDILSRCRTEFSILLLDIMMPGPALAKLLFRISHNLSYPPVSVMYTDRTSDLMGAAGRLLYQLK